MTPEDSTGGGSVGPEERYRRLGHLGTGGMASVFLAEDQILCRRVAIKRVHTASPEDMLRRFRREARIGASLNHPNIVGVFDSISEEDGLLIVMEYVEGDSLSQRLRRQKMDPPAALRILEQVASALDHIHSKGVIHRDVKPSNILLRNDGVAKLADLGIATATDMTAITASGSVLGSLSYIAPERLRGGRVTSACDIFSLGAVAFQMLAGRRLHDAATPEEQIRLASSESTPDLIEAWPEGPPRAAEVLASAMESDPRARPASATAFVSSLAEALAQGEGDDTQPYVAEEPTVTLPLTSTSDPNPRPGPLPAPAPPRIPSPPRPPSRPALPTVPAPERRARGPAVAVLALVAAVVAIAGIAIAASNGGSGGDSGSGIKNPAKSAGAKTTDTGTKGSRSASGGNDGASTPPAAGGTVGASGAGTTDSTTAPVETTPATVPVEGSASASDLNTQGKNLIDQGDPAGAITYLQQAVDSYPAGSQDLTYAYSLFNLGNALRLAGRPEEAITVLEERLNIPDQTDVVQAELDLAIAEAGGKKVK